VLSSEALAQGPSKLHVLLICDTRDAEIGRSMERNLSALHFTITENVPDSRLNLKSIPSLDGSDARPLVASELINRIRQLKGQVGPQDAVALFYSGHGFYNTYLHPDGRAWGTCLSLSGGGPPLSLRTLRTELGNLKPRFSALVIDCCNKTREVPVFPAAPQAPGKVVKPEQPVSPLFDQLFFRSSGGVILNSSKIGQYAFIPNKVTMSQPGQPGQEIPETSLFVQAWQSAIWPNQEKRLNWNQFQGVVQENLDRLVPNVLTRGGVLLGDGRFVAQDRQETQLFVFTRP
jgi:hypothetical protein